MKFLNLCFIAIILSFSSFAYAQTSVCNINQGQFCFDVGYLNEAAKRLYSSEDFDKETSYKSATFGINYGILDTLKFSLLPKINMGSSFSPSDFSPSDFSVGLQLMHGGDVPYLPLKYFAITSGSLYHEDAIYNRESGFIVGGGLYYQSDTERGSLIVFSSFFYEGSRSETKRDLGISPLDDFEIEFKNDFGMDIGAEFKFGKDPKYIIKAKYTVASRLKEDTFDISLTFPPLF